VKGRLLYWGDAGYEIDCLGITAVADFPDRARFPYPIIAASVPGHDPLGYRALARALLARPYDVLLAQNDLQVIHTAAGHLAAMRDRGARLPAIACYYPVDCGVRPDLTGMLALADVVATCTDYGRRETERVLPGRRPPLVIPHGVDSRTFRPILPREERAAARARFRGAHGIAADALLLVSVAVNSIRKDLARTIAAFARLRAAQPRPAVLYLHTAPIDNGLDLHQAAWRCGLVVGRDVVFAEGHHPNRGIPDAALNELYNAADLYITTTLGEGWGLPVTEAMAAGLPVVAPRHSSLQELAGDGRAILYECRESIWVDNSGYRPLGLMDDIVAALVQAISLPELERRRMTEAARDFAVSLDWSRVAPRWVPIIDQLVAAGRDRLVAAGPAE
jgi:glycosyltransferase involved in cell wall biosynthesis